ncbi:ABC transporter permease [Anaerosacchariphilus polymeriproducens]|uniref:ABC transporter permease n=1 Tax=Anaerosacchariphilus polymeriproducens TaxID=1812858 RepID=A0A371AXE8_9FIRM|nr:ABC transporter permease [Anaerosacchariphilus polymeriproducens]RDU24248.1 ABC transporter permease [Anaerosacchariphilus polymeriproducens]
MNSLFYLKLAWTNIKKNSKTYIPYILTSIGMIIVFYILCNISNTSGFDKIRGGASVKTVLGFGNYVVGIFSAIFLFYTNSFLIKNRKKELGLYNILGMEKKHIGKVLMLETIVVGLFSVVLGLILGAVFSKLLFLLFLKILGNVVFLKYIISMKAILYTFVLFTGIFAAALLYNFLQIRLTNPIELLHGGQHGEKEPKTRWLIALVGLASLAGAYYIALTTESPIDSIFLFLIAVIMVMIGTHCLFVAGSIVILKIMKKNKKFYYQTNHFTSVSGMIYRMKQNAVGLSNICILSTTVLVILSTTVSLFLGIEDELKFRYPYEVQINQSYISNENNEKLNRMIEEVNKKYNVKVSDLKSYSTGSMLINKNGTTFKKIENVYNNKSSLVEIYTLDDYNRLLGTKKALNDNEILFHSYKKDYKFDKVSIAGKTYQIKEQVGSMPIPGDSTTRLLDSYYLVVKDIDTVKEIAGPANDAKKPDSSIKHSYVYNLDPKMERYADYVQEIKTKIKESKDVTAYIEFREENRVEFKAMYGSLLFIGVFLGTSFMMATVLIIYYKQISEGYDDKERYTIMQKVGMSKSEVRNTIKSQIVMVFFIPLVMAAIHVAFAFKILNKILFLMNLFNTSLFITCTISCVLVFAVIYTLVYSMTAKAYYKIVN